MQLRSWMIPAEACPGTFVTLKGACGKTTTTIYERFRDISYWKNSNAEQFNTFFVNKTAHKFKMSSKHCAHGTCNSDTRYKFFIMSTERLFLTAIFGHLTSMRKKSKSFF